MTPAEAFMAIGRGVDHFFGWLLFDTAGWLLILAVPALGILGAVHHGWEMHKFKRRERERNRALVREMWGAPY